MKRLLFASVMAMTLTAIATTVSADEPAAPAPTVAPAGATPLAVRPTPAPKPLALAPANEGLGLGYKLLAIVGIGGAVALYLKKKRGPGAAAPAPSKIDILARSGIGVRSQLVVVEVEGTRLLVGMTPSSIQTLAVLQTPEDHAFVAAPAELEERHWSTPAPAPARSALEMVRTPNLGERVRSLLGSEDPVMPRISPVKSLPPKPRAVRPSARANVTRTKAEASRDPRDVAGQARGLLLSSDEDT